jgi:hypothetical protein
MTSIERDTLLQAAVDLRRFLRVAAHEYHGVGAPEGPAYRAACAAVAALEELARARGE